MGAHLGRQIVAVFKQMRPNVDYVLTPADWAAYQQMRAENGHGRLPEYEQPLIRFRKIGQTLCLPGPQLIWDFAAKPNPEAPIFAERLGFALAGCANLAFFSFVFFRFVPVGRIPDALQPASRPIPDGLAQWLDLSGTAAGFWFEQDGLRISGDQTSLMISDLTEDQQAQILALVKTFRK